MCCGDSISIPSPRRVAIPATRSINALLIALLIAKKRGILPRGVIPVAAKTAVSHTDLPIQSLPVPPAQIQPLAEPPIFIAQDTVKKLRKTKVASLVGDDSG